MHRRWHHDRMTFGLIYAFAENFVLPLSHDEVVHGKRSLLGRIPGDAWQQFATLRALLRGDVGASRQEAPVHGPGVRAGPRVEFRRGARLAVAGHRLASRRAIARPRLQSRVRAPNARCTSAIAKPRASAGSWSTTPTTPSSRGCASHATARDRWPSSRTSRRCRAPAYRIGLPEPGRWREILNTDARGVWRIELRQRG